MIIKVIKRPLLTHGMLATDEWGNILIMLDSEQSEEQLAITYWHELVHAILMLYGIEGPHDETKVDEIAHQLYNIDLGDKHDS